MKVKLPKAKANIKRVFPWIPLIGIPLTLINHIHDTGIENRNISILSAIWQTVSICGIIVLPIILAS
jgi:hypothetical protein